MPLIPDGASFQKQFADLPTINYQAGEIVLSAGSRTNRLVILKKGVVTIVRNGLQIARVSEPGTVFGELSFLLDQPYAVDVRAIESSEFQVADAATFLPQHPFVFSEIAPILTKRIDIANQLLIELKDQLNGIDEPRWQKYQESPLDDTGASLVYAGYPCDPYAIRSFLTHQLNAVCLLLSAR
jgi:CRP/FNR family transcriptional regulator, cyclic AMP receptor protein